MTDQEQQPSSNLPNKTEAKTNGEKESGGPLDPEVLDKLPPEVRKAVESFSLQAFSAPVFNPILNKITESHVDKVLDQTEKESEREFKDRQQGRTFALLYGLIAAALFVFVTIYLAGLDKELYRDLLTKIIIFFGGSGIGYGIKAFRDRDD
jgi:hypothetical protein